MPFPAVELIERISQSASLNFGRGKWNPRNNVIKSSEPCPAGKDRRNQFPDHLRGRLIIGNDTPSQRLHRLEIVVIFFVDIVGTAANGLNRVVVFIKDYVGGLRQQDILLVGK